MPVRQYLSIFIISLFCASVSSCTPNQSSESSGFRNIPAPQLKRMSHEQYGIEVESRKVVQAHFERNQFLTDILKEHNVDPSTINQVAEKSEEVFDVRRMRAGNSFTILKNESHKVDYFIYEKNQAEFVVIDLRDSVDIYEGTKQVALREKEVAGVISSSLFETIQENNINVNLAWLLEESYAWSVDFFHLKKGDYFKVIYEEEFVEGTSIGISKIIAAQFQHNGEDFYAIPFDQGDGVEFFDESGRSLRKSFLKAPLKYTRNSSRYMNSRFMAIRSKGRSQGVDYFAPTGTPILAVADGEVTKARYKKGLGNYVKIQHSEEYETQYLYMSNIADNIAAGSKIQQGDVIGYVGSTGSAKNPRVSLRLWKNGKSIDPRSIEVPLSEPISEEKHAQFEVQKAEIMARLSQIQLGKAKETFVSRD